jgi:hypothetical protein
VNVEIVEEDPAVNEAEDPDRQLGAEDQEQAKEVLFSDAKKRRKKKLDEVAELIMFDEQAFHFFF